MNQKTIEAENYAIKCSTYDDRNSNFDSYDAKEMRECAFMRGYETALLNHQWIDIKKKRPEDGAHCFIRKRESNDSKHWQWDYSIAEFKAAKMKNQAPIFRVYDMTVRLKEVTHWMLIPEVTLSHDKKSKK